MSDNRIVVNVGGREIVLLGTAHVSRESIDEVKLVITEEKPEAVCVELDEGRFASMSQKENWENLNIMKVIKDGKGFLLIANLVLSSFQRRLGNELGVKPGDEMKMAVDTATELGIPFAFCDRQVQITLSRAWGKCGFWSKCKLLASLTTSALTTEKLSEDEIESLKDSNELDSMMAELAKYLPSVKKTLIDERDRFLAAKIWSTAGNKLVAVVGAGHLKGLAAHLESIAAGSEDANVDDLNVLPPKGVLARAAGTLIPLAILALIGAGFIRYGAALSLNMLVRWLLWNGSLAALGTIVALGHPLSVLVSFVGAPLGTLSPVLSIGMFSGVVQAWVRKPRVSDAQAISEDVTGIKGIYRNRITRALLVFFLSSLGGAIGNIISIPHLAVFFSKGLTP
jgi:pheromone shutdown-related protein TraB